MLHQQNPREMVAGDPEFLGHLFSVENIAHGFPEGLRFGPVRGQAREEFPFPGIALVGMQPERLVGFFAGIAPIANTFVFLGICFSIVYSCR